MVADTVRKSAERTTKSTKENSNMIMQILSYTNDAVKNMLKEKEEVNRAKKIVNSAGKRFKENISGSEEVVKLVENVATTSKIQSSSSEEISNSIETIREVTCQTGMEFNK